MRPSLCAALGEPSAPPTEALRDQPSGTRLHRRGCAAHAENPSIRQEIRELYRLYKATLSTPALARFLGTPEHPGNFRAVQVLLALVIGAPDLAMSVVSVLDGLSETDARTLSKLPS